MDWLWGAALLPLVTCGAMCIGGMALAAVGLRRRSRAGAGSDDQRSEAGDHEHVAPPR